jgi:hypothetical protein
MNGERGGEIGVLSKSTLPERASFNALVSALEGIFCT